MNNTDSNAIKADASGMFKGVGGTAESVTDPGLFEQLKKADALDKDLSELTLSKAQVLKEALGKKYGLKPNEIIQCYKDLQARKTKAQEDDSEERLAEIDPMALDPEPWAEDVDLYELILETTKILKNHVVFKDGYQITACALWIVATWFVDQFDYAPYLMVSSPLKRCGKSTLMKVIERLSYRPAGGALMSASAVYRMLEKRQRTLIIDEADNFVKYDPEFKGVLLCGIERDGVATNVWKCDKDYSGQFDSRPYSCFAFKAIAGIKAEWILSTLTDRAIVITLRRRTDKDNCTLGKKQLERCRFEEIRRKLFKASIQWAERVKNAKPISNIRDREEEKWLPLLKVADAVADPNDSKAPASQLGSFARDCAEKLQFDESAAVSTSGEELLRCMLSLRQKNPYGSSIHQKDLLTKLNQEEDWEWRNLNHGKGLSAKGLTQMLASFDIKSSQCKIEGYNRNGYKWSEIYKACETYGLKVSVDSDASQETSADY